MLCFGFKLPASQTSVFSVVSCCILPWLDSVGLLPSFWNTCVVPLIWFYELNSRKLLWFYILVSTHAQLLVLRSDAYSIQQSARKTLFKLQVWLARLFRHRLHSVITPPNRLTIALVIVVFNWGSMGISNGDGAVSKINKIPFSDSMIHL